jgi:hypothetical protein
MDGEIERTEGIDPLEGFRQTVCLDDQTVVFCHGMFHPCLSKIFETIRFDTYSSSRLIGIRPAIAQCKVNQIDRNQLNPQVIDLA